MATVVTQTHHCYIICTLHVLLHNASGIKCITQLCFFIDALKHGLITKAQVVGCCSHGDRTYVFHETWGTS